MTVALVSHPDCILHEPPAGHPERPDRLRAVIAALGAPRFDALDRRLASLASEDLLRLAHPAAHVAGLLATDVAPGDVIALDPDTHLGAGSIRAARLAAGGACDAVDAVLAGEATRAFVAVRPPGHHAEAETPMGFCLFGSVAIAAFHARRRWGLRRIAIADFDVHHGNGTQSLVERDPDILFVSSHQHPCYPGTGPASDTGVADNVLNLPLPPGTGSTRFRAAWSAAGLPAIDRFAPELLLVSAGFDAHRADPLAQLCLDAEDFAWLTAELVGIADRRCAGRLVSVLEGGYDLDALAECAARHVEALVG